MTARDVATSRIAYQAKRFPDLDLRPPDADGSESLDPRDAALAAAIEHAVLRRWLTLSAIIETQLSRPWVQLEHKMQGALLSGAAQLLLFDRLPDYAVIDEMVEWAKSNVRAKAGGMINAVLRRIAALRGEPSEGTGPAPTSWRANDLPLHDGRVLALKGNVFAQSDLQRLAQQTSHPIELLEHWISVLGREAAAKIAAHDLVHAPIIVHGLTDEEAQGDVHLLPHREKMFLVLEGSGQTPITGFLRAQPQAIVQDPAAAAPVLATAQMTPAPKIVIDVCAGKGTKTRQLALAHPAAEIVATDVDRSRLRALKETFAGHDRVRVIDHDRLMGYAGRADLVVLDVPCSNTGVLARRVEAKYRFSRASLKELVDLQRQIIADSLRLLEPRGGRLLYATCSIDPAENQQQAQWITQWHPLAIEQAQAREPRGLPGDAPTEYSDGGYWALLGRRGA